MNAIVAICGGLAATLLVGCSGGNGVGAVHLEGTYSAVGPGDFGSITFSDAEHYAAVRSDCNCTVSGSYYLDAWHNLLALDDAKTHKITEFDFHYYDPNADKVNLGSTGLHTLGGVPLNGGGGALNQDGGVLAQDGGALGADGGALTYDGGTLTFDGGTMYQPNTQLLANFTANGQPFQAAAP